MQAPDARVTSERQWKWRIWEAWFREDWQRIARAALLASLALAIAGTLVALAVVLL